MSTSDDLTQRPPLVIYHGNCRDGFTAAWVAARCLGDCELYPAFYAQRPPDVTGRRVYILDFSYPRTVMEHLAATAAWLIVLDHHKTAEADLAGLVVPQGAVVFDMQHSGAMLTYRYFYQCSRWGLPTLEAHWLVRYVEDRDLWRWQLPQSRLVNAGIELTPLTLEDWDRLARRTVDDVAAEGEIVERYKALCIDAAHKLARPALIAGHRVVAANSSEMRFASDVAGQLAEGRTFAATYWIRQDGKVQFSLRSREDGADVADIAKMYGGGGHPHAAGFETTLAGLVEILS